MTVSNSQPSTPPIAIVGGGLGGLALAIGLLAHNVPLKIYEAAPAFSEIGAGVAFGPNSMRALSLLDPRILAGYVKHATFNHDPARATTFASLRHGVDARKADQDRKRGVRGSLIAHLDDPAEEWMIKEGLRTRSCVHRARFLEELIKLIPVDVAEFGKSVERVVEDEQAGVVVLHFADGTTALARAVVGCDGIKSRTRDAVCGTGIGPRFTGEYAYRAMVAKEIAVKVLGEELALNGQIYCGYGGYIVSYPVEHGEFVNIVAVRRKEGSTWKDAQWVVPTTKEELLEDFEGWYPPIIALLSSSKNPNPEKWALFDLQHNISYYKGRVCLLGDSAHASTPHMGAGAGMAMEDAYILSNLIGALKDLGNLEVAFHAFDAVRRPRTQDVVKSSRLNGLAFEFMKEDLKGDLESWILDVEARFGRVWHEDFKKELQEAVNAMG